MKQLAFTLMEQGNDSCPMIGTIIADNVAQATHLFVEAVEAHFDSHLSIINLQDGYGWMELHSITKPIDAKVTIDGNEHVITIHPTWIYKQS